jgi:glycosyltransferase involved in cell wall biosynthesis
MNWPAQCAAVIPCLNEEQAIATVVGRVREILPAVIVVDDGSMDATARQAEAAGAIVLRHAENEGKGISMRDGLEKARSLGFAWAVLMDGDGQHSPQDLRHFTERAAATDASLIVGNRMHNPASMPWLRRQVNRWMSRQLSKIAGQPLPDTQCGFRLVRLDAWAQLDLRTERFEVESEWLLAFARAGLRIEFVPVQVIYESERSKINPLLDTWRWFRWLRTRRR